MIVASAHWHIRDEKDVDFIKDITDSYDKYAQPAFYLKGELGLIDGLLDADHTKLSSMYLPIDTSVEDFSAVGFVTSAYDLFGIKRFVLDAESSDLNKIIETLVENPKEYKVCIKNSFLNRGQASLLSLLSNFGKLFEQESFGLALDISHLETGLGNFDFVEGLLPYTKMIMSSGRLKKAVNLPMFHHNYDINPIHVLSRVLKVKKLEVEEVCLQYSVEYKQQLMKHLFWTAEYIVSQRGRWGGER